MRIKMNNNFFGVLKMRRNHIWIMFTLLAGILLCSVSSLQADYLGGEYLSPVDMAVSDDWGKVYVAETTAGRIDVVDMSSKEVVGSVELEQNPTGIAISKSGKTLYVTGEGAEGKLFVIDVEKMKVANEIGTGHTPMAPVVSCDGNMVYVCNRFDNNIAMVDLGKKEVVEKIAVTREPVDSILSKCGKYLYVANHLPYGDADDGELASEVQVIDMDSKEVVKSIELPNGSTSLEPHT
jgi:DNA-binding beta-propeller fold protein YncE